PGAGVLAIIADEQPLGHARPQLPGRADGQRSSFLDYVLDSGHLLRRQRTWICEPGVSDVIGEINVAGPCQRVDPVGRWGGRGPSVEKAWRQRSDAGQRARPG